MNRENNSQRDIQNFLSGLGKTIENCAIANFSFASKSTSRANLTEASLKEAELEQAGKVALASIQELAAQFLSHQKLRQELELYLEPFLQAGNDEEKSPLVLKLWAQINIMKRAEETIAEGLNLLPQPPSDTVRRPAALEPIRNNPAEGFYFPRR